jgi:hypothetical protein
MDERVVSVEQDFGTALDFDVLGDGTWVGLFQRSEGIFVLSSQGTEFAVRASVSFPIVRFVDSEHVVVVSQRAVRDAGQSFIARLDGTSQVSLSAGDGVADVVVLRDLIAVTYFDEGVFSGIAPSEQGIAFFDFQGQLFAGYRSLFGSDAVDIVDCYAACRVDHHTIGFSAYLGFDLAWAAPRDLKHRAEPLPETLHGAAAVTFQRDRVYLFSPYVAKGSLVECTPGGAREIGRHPGPLRGLEYGRFLSNGEHGFTVITCDAG